ncbi:biliverdin-producing heme oxygenase [Nocardioides sp. T2.26MG-1]|uniref:biliverdin-producing heme oxygenase n=1 Tax=Nocardioides sp. T2.26MG-1 TaxID=3041166 RepID=UPI0024775E10|nr:biliverdin-producing heme oxygenase [Nocardioides sp. T2.26MG-1]CAI9413944.1 Heme oxygenase 1 [Nocardioides sp. T2.26MG-1]
MTVADQQTTVALSVAMREGSHDQHRLAESAPFLTELLAGRADRRRYADYLLRLRAVYDALESALHEHADHPVVAAVHDPALGRLAAIDADLDHWLPDGPRSTDSAAAAAYCSRIHEAAATPALLVAHHYTRYLGDLSGGQVIGRLLEHAYGLGGRGRALYAFPEVAAPPRYRRDYRARLDGLDLSPADRDRVVAEVPVAFGLNRALLGELETSGT